VLFDVPVPADLDGRLYPREYAAYRAALAAVARDHGVPLLYATRETVGLTDADFADMIHLNSDGAARLSAWLRARLEETDAGGRP
jgi:lysophospholipase L1-like esterase